MKDKAKILAMFFAVLVMVSTAQGEIIYVDDDATGANDGSSWVDAFNYLQEALAAAQTGDEIRVAQGIYKPGPPGSPGPLSPPPAPPPSHNVSVPPAPPLPPPTAERTTTFQLINGVTLKGGYAGFGETDPDTRDINAYETILSGDLAGNDVSVNDPFDLLNDQYRVENSCHVVTGNGVDMTAVLDGFTITAGNANSAYPYSCGGGMYNLQGSPTQKDCTFSANSAIWRGGAIAIHGSNAAVTNCTFIENLGGQGGGISNWFGNPTVINCKFSMNAAESGGGMHNTDGSRPTLINCNFSKNSARYNGGGMFSGSDSITVLTNCTFISNSAGFWGGGIIAYIHDRGIVTINNCTITGNDADWGSGICCLGNTFLTNSIVWNNTGEDIYIRNFPPPSPPPCLYFSTQYPAKLTVSYSCPGVILVEEDAILILGDGNIDADPLFVEPGYWALRDDPNIVVEPNDPNAIWVDGDYHLLAGSPCIDAGDPNYIPEPNETDLDGNPRIINGRIDMGAYEYSPPMSAEVRIIPRTINLTSKGNWITCYIWLPERYNVADIDPNRILLEHEIEPKRFWLAEDEQVAIARFSREELRGIINTGEVELTITGQLKDGTIFEGIDVIRVIDEGRKKN